jgi:hypothetical protein
MKFQDPSNPYFGGGKLTPQEWVDKSTAEMADESAKDEFESEQPVGYGIKTVHEIIVAFGGPDARYYIDVDDKHNIVSGVWEYAWWGDNEKVELTAEQAETVMSYYGIEA